VYLVANDAMFVDIVNHLDEWSLAKSGVYSAWLECGFATFAIVMLAAPARWLWLVVPLVFVSLTTNYAFLGIVKDPLTVDVIQWLPYETSQLGNASREYASEIAFAAARAAALLVVFLGLRFVVQRHDASCRAALRVRRWAPAAFAAFFAAGLALQPPMSVAETNLYVFGLPAAFEQEPSPRPLAARPLRDSALAKVVLVIDESVTWEAFEKVIAARIDGLPAIDFGEAASLANCSAPSNALLRWGVDMSRVRDPAYDPRTNPTIWAYARAAGYRTTLIDGQSEGQKQNYLTPGELALIDAFVPAKRASDTDVRLAERVNAELRRPGRAFIVVVKRGTHFPYEMNYPRGMVARDAPRALKYVAAVAHTSGRFFDTLDRDLRWERTLVIYTSDHGQDLARRSTHCNPRPKAEEYSVPLVAITAQPTLAAALSASPLSDRASHLNIFPTLVEAVGYGPDVARAYGPTLAGGPIPYLTYVNRGWHARQSRSERHTVRATDFVQSAGFPFRRKGEPRHMALEGIDASGLGMR
jgi:hypothetical protein